MSGITGKGRLLLQAGLAVMGMLSFVLVLHNSALNLLPNIWEDIEPAAISVDQAGAVTTYRFAFSGSTPDGPHASLSRVQLTQDGVVLAGPPLPASVGRAVGGGNWVR